MRGGRLMGIAALHPSYGHVDGGLMRNGLHRHYTCRHSMERDPAVRKIDLKKDYKPLYQPPASAVVQVDVPAFAFLMIDGIGDPNTTPAYAEAVEALFSVSYAAKFMVKKGAQGVDYAVMPLEGLWWSDDLSAFASND